MPRRHFRTSPALPSPSGALCHPRHTAPRLSSMLLLQLALPAIAIPPAPRLHFHGLGSVATPAGGPRLGLLALATATPASADGGLLAGMDATRQAKLQAMAAEADAKDLLCVGRYPWQIQDLSPWDLTFDPPCYTRLHTQRPHLHCRASTGPPQGTCCWLRASSAAQPSKSVRSPLGRPHEP